MEGWPTSKIYINEAICQKLRNKYVYKSGLHKIYNLIAGKTEQLQEKVVSGATYQAVNID